MIDVTATEPAPATSAPTAPTATRTISAPAASTAIPVTGGEQEIDYSKYIGKDGKFLEGYKDALLPEDQRANKFFDTWGTDIKSILKVAGNQATMLGKYANTKGILPINERSTPFEIQAFREGMGVPKDGTGYKYELPQDISPEDVSPELTKMAFDRMNKVDSTPRQVNEMMNVYYDYIRQIEKEVMTELNNRTKAADERLNKEWGENRPVRMDLAKRFIDKMTGLWSGDKFKELCGEEIVQQDGSTTREGGINTPEFAALRPLLLDLFATIEEKYGIPDTATFSETSSSAAKSIEEQLKEVEATPDFMNGKLRTSQMPEDRAKHEELMKKRHDLITKQVELENKSR